MTYKNYAVTLERTVTERLTVLVSARSKRDAHFAAGVATKDSPDDEWARDPSSVKVAAVEIAQPEPADPMAVPAVLKREAHGS